MQQTYKLADYIFWHAFIAIITDPFNHNSFFLCRSDIHIGVLRRIQAAAHPNILNIRAGIQHLTVNLACIAQKYRVGIADPFDNRRIILWNTVVKL